MTTQARNSSTGWTPSAPTSDPGKGQARQAAVGEAAARARGLLRAAEAMAYWLATAPLLALLPAALAYRAACLRADLAFRSWPEKRSEIQMLPEYSGLSSRAKRGI